MGDNQNSLQQIFTQVYRENRWGSTESASGDGSALSSQPVLESIKALDELVRRLKIRSINDIPCGDFHWIPIIMGRFPFVEYHGFDIVPDLISLNRARYPHYDFQELDIVEEIPPQADMIFCKDLLLHLPHYDIAKALRNFKLSGSRFLLVSMVPGSSNRELVIEDPGEFRHVDLTRGPFGLPQPQWSLGFLSLWTLDALDIEVFDTMCERLLLTKHVEASPSLSTTNQGGPN